MLKILQAKLLQYINCELPDVKLDLEKAEEPEIILPTSSANIKKAKWLSEEALQIAVERREAKSQGGKERYRHLNAEFQRIEEKIRKPSSAINAKK